MVDGKAKLVREHFCDGFGDCLPSCPTGAITFEEREAPAYDEAAVKKAQEQAEKEAAQAHHATGGCPGSRIMQIKRKAAERETEAQTGSVGVRPVSRLQNWPVQIRLRVLS